MLAWIPCLLLCIAAAGLWGKVRLLERAFDEILEGLSERVEGETNTLLTLSTRDRHARALASALNGQLRKLRERRLRFENGDRELREAVTGLSHDLRTPLTAIRGYLDLMSRQDLPPEARRYLELIGERAEAMTRLTEELFCYSQTRYARELRLERVDLRAAVEEAVSGFYAALTARGIEPSVTLPEAPVVRVLDRTALGRVLGNILSNAIKYSAGDLEIALSPEGGLRFTNTAPGLDGVAAGRLFDRFFTVEAARDSTGLGLSIARSLTKEMGGSIGAACASNRLTVWLKFP